MFFIFVVEGFLVYFVLDKFLVDFIKKKYVYLVILDVFENGYEKLFY